MEPGSLDFAFTKRKNHEKVSLIIYYLSNYILRFVCFPAFVEAAEYSFRKTKPFESNLLTHFVWLK